MLADNCGDCPLIGTWCGGIFGWWNGWKWDECGGKLVAKGWSPIVGHVKHDGRLSSPSGW